MKYQLLQTQKQQLILSPQLKQYLQLLQMPLLDLQQSIEQTLAQNPVLEEIGTQTETQQEETGEDLSGTIEQDQQRPELPVDDLINQMRQIDEESRTDMYQNTDYANRDGADILKKHDYQESLLSQGQTLANYLEWQSNFLSFNHAERRIAVQIIGNIDEDGYLAATIEDIAKETGTAVEQVENILGAIQTLDPPGVGGRNLSEVLLIQLERNHADDLPKQIIRCHLRELERKQLDAIAKALSVGRDRVSKACQSISRLEPKPGRVFYQKDPISIVPDVIIVESDNPAQPYRIEINHEVIPELRINRLYRKMARQKGIDPRTKAFLRERIQSAMLYLRALGDRKSTLRRIAEVVVDIQKDFLEKGFASLKPLRLRDVAERLKIHESTISRAISGKYVKSPQGTISFKSFFSTGLAGQNGEIESQKSIVEKIRHFIDGENKGKPLSDAKIAVLLEAEDIRIARRTVAKYREMLRILPTHLRKVR